MLEEGFYQYIRTVELEKNKIASYNQYPFCLEAIQQLKELKLHPNVTFLVGENGSGKSTLLEGIAVACGFNPEGGSKNFNFATEETHSSLHHYLKITKGVKAPKDGFFLRAESFYNVASEVNRLEREGIPGLIEASYGGRSLHEQSHGESFISLIMNRLRGKGLYIFDEPEAALSPTRQMAFVSRLHELVKQDSQFIIATHSPIIMAYPHATIYSIDHGLTCVNYTDTEHYQVTKSFVNNTKKMLEVLLEED